MDKKQTSSFVVSEMRTAEILKALSHPARISIMKLLADKQTCICGDITDQLPLAQSTVSQHLKALKKAGLIKGEIDGVKTCYCIEPDGISELESLVLSLIDQLKAKPSNCC
ncbi:ArsR/SmtB family transcription factor [Balneola sp. MJW-20]|uniref:ArsR/SmtB family transcription factor n=1 Tax=Gracilimonas aurantiaca TaxID=3234185 RepID=UPI00346705B3